MFTLHSDLCLITSTNRMREKEKDGGREDKRKEEGRAPFFSRIEMEFDSTRMEKVLACTGAGDLGRVLFSVVLNNLS